MNVKLSFCCAMLCSLMCGCGAKPMEDFKHLELVPVEEELHEFPLGMYLIPVTGVPNPRPTVTPPRNRMQLEFELIAEIKPEHQAQLEQSWERHESQIRDRVIKTFRSATFEDLDEPDLVTLKSHLLKEVSPFVGAKRIIRLLIPQLQRYAL